jgi:hypothetical protein
MNEFDFKPNSHKYKQEQKEKTEREKKFTKAVVTGPVKTKKKSKFAETFLADDVSTLGSFLLKDKIIPGIKTLIVEAVDIFLNGTTSRTSFRNTRSGGISYIDYASKTRTVASQVEPATRTGFAYEDIVVNTRAEAEEVLTRLDEAIEAYGMVSIADLYDLVGITSDYTDQKYGWKNLRSAEAQRVTGGYWLKLPKAIPLD